jgi:hypothetical protein
VLANTALCDRCKNALERAGIEVHREELARGARLRKAAFASDAELLCFAHADTQLPANWESEVERCLANRVGWGAFRLRFDDETGRERIPWVSWGANLRTRLFALPYGDQAPFVHRELYERVDGHPDWPLLDDLELSRRLRRVQRPQLSRLFVRSSARRYLQRGRVRTVLQHNLILLRHALGQSPERLHQRFRT